MGSSNAGQMYNVLNLKLEEARQLQCVCTQQELKDNSGCKCVRAEQVTSAKTALNKHIAETIAH